MTVYLAAAGAGVARPGGRVRTACGRSGTWRGRTRPRPADRPRPRPPGSTPGAHNQNIFCNHENIFHLGEYGAGQAGLQHDGLDLRAGQLALLGAGSAEHGAPPAQCRYVDI